ncbi:MAG TPA: hypothetical protein VLJ15_01740 [Gammaproteobacteria bacterium]|nr:hypothetical protein [Gammaproteobacteria bacterium]
MVGVRKTIILNEGVELQTVNKKSVRVPLSTPKKSFFQKRWPSSAQYENLMLDTIVTPVDLYMTYEGRYPQLCDQIFSGNSDATGPGIGFTAHDPTHTFFLLCLAVLLVTGNAAREYYKQQKIKEHSSYEHIRQALLDEEKDGVSKKKKQATDAAAAEETVKKAIERHLPAILKDNPELGKKYESVTIDKNEWVFKLREENYDLHKKLRRQNLYLAYKNHWFNRRILNPVYTGTFISACMYWLMWISVGSYVGRFSNGIVGLSTPVAFGIPAAIGLLYPLVKTINFVRHYKRAATPAPDVATDDEQAMVEADKIAIMRQVVLRQRFDAATETLQKELKEASKNPDLLKVTGQSEKLHAQIQLLAQNNGDIVSKKNTLSWFTNMVSMYVNLQYVSWITSDFLLLVGAGLESIPVINTIMGSAIIAGSVLYGIYKAGIGHYARQNVAVDAKVELAKQAETGVLSLEAQYRNTLKEINQIKAGLSPEDRVLPMTLPELDNPQFGGARSRTSIKWWSQVKKAGIRSLTFINSITTAAFVMRCLLIKGAAIYLPFAAAAFSNPVTIALIFGVGILYGALKVYEYNINRKQAKAEEALKESVEKTKHLTQQVQLANLALRVFQKRRDAEVRHNRSSFVQEDESARRPSLLSSLKPLKTSSLRWSFGGGAPSNDPTQPLRSRAPSINTVPAISVR